MSAEDFLKGRRNFLIALGGIGSASLGLAGAAQRETPMERFDRATGKSMCVSPSSLSALRLDPGALPNDLTLVGTRLMKLGFLDEATRLYRQRTGKKVRVIGGGCDDGLISARSGKAHFGELCCPVEGSPAAGMYWLPVAHDMKVILTSPDNPVQSISMDNLRRVASGEIQNWRYLGGVDRPIAFIVHNHCPTYLEPVRSVLLNGRESWSGSAMLSNTDSDHLRQLARFSHSLGIDSWVLAMPYVKRGQLKVLSIDGIPPVVGNEAHARYPLRGPLNLIFALWLEEQMRPYLDFLYGEEVRQIIAKRAVPILHKEALALGNAPEYRDRSSGTPLKRLG